MLMKSWLILASLMLSLPLLATNKESDYHNNVQWAKGSINQNQSKSDFKNFDVNSLCRDATCQREVANPSQSRYYNNPSALKKDALRESGRNEQSQAVTTSFNQDRPTIDPNDPAYHAAVGYQNDAYNISHGISSKYHDCDKGLRCDVVNTTRTCTLPTRSPVKCDITPYIKHVSNKRKEYSFQVPSFQALPQTFTIPTAATLVAVKFQGEITTTFYVSSERIYVNGQLLGDAPLTELHCSMGLCRVSINSQFTVPSAESTTSYTFDAKSITTTGVVTEQSLTWALPITLVVNEASVEIGYTDNCPVFLPECKQIKSQCIAGRATRIINGHSVTVDCWDKQLTYQCNTPNTCAALSQCSVTSSSCDAKLGGVCITQKQKRQCETKQCQDVGLVCGADSFALSGDYYQPDTSRNSDFNKAAAGLAAMGEAGQDVKNAMNITEDSAIIFKGEVMKCSNKAMGLSNCCQDSGWGNDIGITSCSEEEKALGTAKEDKLTISLGQYCAEKVLGVCIRKKKSYCTFSSKLARIVQQEGKAQLGLNFGSAKHPNCIAFTPNQLQRINMESMDFSDFYEDLHEGMIVPDTSEIQQRLQQSMRDN